MSRSDDSLKRIASGAGIIFIGIMVSKVLTYLFRLVIARYGTAEYGLITLSMTIVTFVTIFATLGLDKGIYKYIPLYKEKGEPGKVKGVLISSLKYSMALSLILAALFFIFADWIAATFFPNLNQNLLVTILRIMTLTIPFTNLSKMLMFSFKAFQKPQYEVYTKNIIESVIKVTFALLFFLLGVSIVGIAAVYVFSTVASTLIGLALLKKAFPALGNVKAEYKDRELLRFSLPLIFMGIFLTIMASIDTFMIGYFKDEAAVGIYNATSPTAQLMYVIPYALLALFLPVLTEHYVKGDRNSLKRVYTLVTKWILAFCIILFLAFSLYSKEFLGLFFGNDFIPGYLSLIFLAFGFMINFTLYPSENILLILNKPNLIFWNSMVVSVLNIALNWIMISKMGIDGAALATSISFIAWGIMLFIESYYYLKIHPFSFNIIKIIIIGAVTGLIFYYLRRHVHITSLAMLVAMVCALSLFFLMLMLLTRSLDREDFSLIRSAARKVGIKAPFLGGSQDL